MKKFLLLTLISLSILGCKKDYLNKPPLSDIVEDNFYKTEDDAQKAIVAAYACLQSGHMFKQNFPFMSDLASDDATFRDSTFTDHGRELALYDNFGWNPSLLGTSLTEMWGKSYEGIQRSNKVIENVPNISMDQTRKNQIIAQARFLRGLYYFYLKTLFGKVPLYPISPKSYEDLFKSEASLEEINQQINDDFNFAIGNLPNAWSIQERGRATKYSAYAFLGKNHLYNQQWENAKNAFEKVITESDRALVPKFKDVFAKGYNSNINTQESLFEIQFRSGFAKVAFGNFFTDGGVSGEGNTKNVYYGIRELNPLGGSIIGTKDLYNEFEPNDPRLKETLWTVGDTALYLTNPVLESGYGSAYSSRMSLATTLGRKIPKRVGEFYNIKKMTPGQVGTNPLLGSNDDDSPDGIILMRLADVKLMYAEALAEAAQAATGQAISQLNDIRRRARTSSINTNVLPDFPSNTRYGGNLLAINYNKTTQVTTFSQAAPYYAGDTVIYSSDLNSFRKALVHERRVELAFEGTRYLDMIRWSKIPNHPGNAATIFTSKSAPRANLEDKKSSFMLNVHSLLPKPQFEIDKSNGSLVQNPGY